MKSEMICMSNPDGAVIGIVADREHSRACGSTVGPMLSKIGLRTVDVGCAILSMHSIREQAGVQDVQSAIDLFSSFFEGFASLSNSLTVD